MNVKFVLKDCDRAKVNELLGGMYSVTVEEEPVSTPTCKLVYRVQVDTAICSSPLLHTLLEQMTRLKGELFMVEKGLGHYE
jgi:hypothetical protein